jgi:hypothetical protein
MEILVWLFFPFIFFVFFVDIYSTRYLIPLLPAAGLIIGLTLSYALKKTKLLFFTFLFIIIIKNYLIIAYADNKNFTYNDIDLREDKHGLQSVKSYTGHIKPLETLVKKYLNKKKAPLKMLALFNTLEVEYLRYEMVTRNQDIELDTGFMEDTFYKWRPYDILSSQDILLLKSDKYNFLRRSDLFPKDFIDKMQNFLNNFRENPQDFVYIDKINLIFAGRKYTYFVYVEKELAG